MAESIKNTYPLTKKYIDHNPYNCLGILWSDSKKLRIKKTTELKRYLEVSQVPDDFRPIYTGQSYIPLLEIGEEGFDSMEQALTNDRDRLISSLFAFGSLDDVVDPVVIEMLKTEKNAGVNEELVTLWNDQIKTWWWESIHRFSASMNLSAYYFNLGESFWTEGLKVKSKALEGSMINYLYEYIDIDQQKYPIDKVIDLLSEVLYEKFQSLTIQSQTNVLMALESAKGVCEVGFMRFAARRKENELKSNIESVEEDLSKSFDSLDKSEKYIKIYIEQFNLLRLVPIDKIKLSQLAKEAKDSIRRPLVRNWNKNSNISSAYASACIRITTGFLSLPLGISERDSTLSDKEHFEREMHNIKAQEPSVERFFESIPGWLKWVLAFILFGTLLELFD